MGILKIILIALIPALCIIFSVALLRYQHTHNLLNALGFAFFGVGGQTLAILTLFYIALAHDGLVEAEQDAIWIGMIIAIGYFVIGCPIFYFAYKLFIGPLLEKSRK